MFIQDGIKNPLAKLNDEKVREIRLLLPTHSLNQLKNKYKIMNEKRLYRSRIHKVFGGVCAGLGDYFNMDLVLVRLLYALGLVFGCGFFLLLYVALWIAVPIEPIVVP